MEINISPALQIEQPMTQGPRAICQDQQGARYPDNSFYSKHLTKFIPIRSRAPAGRGKKKLPLKMFLLYQQKEGDNKNSSGQTKANWSMRAHADT